MKTKKAKQNTARGRRAAHWLLAMLALAAIATSVGACNLVVESATDQCTTDADCSKFNNGSVCKQGLCVLAEGSSNSSSSSSSGMGGAGGMGGGGMGGAGGTGGAGPTCFSGTPTTDVQFYNQCTNATCVEFDNCARLGLCNGAALPPLVDPPTP